jgi:hypothetical protein
MNGELERIWKEVAVTKSRRCPDIFKERLKKLKNCLLRLAGVFHIVTSSGLKIKLGNKPV